MNDSYIVPLFIAVTILFVVFVFFIIFFILLHKQKRNRLKIEKQKAVFEEQERTMAQVSKEVHDNLGGMLNLAMMNIEIFKAASAYKEQKEAIEHVSNIITELITDVHNIRHSMNSNYIQNRGLYDILHNQLKRISASKKMHCNVEVSGENFLNPEQELLVYRIAQEAIQNVIKHSKATQLLVSLHYEQRLFKMTIADNGIGFITNNDFHLNGIGLMNMQERANLLKGKLEIKTGVETGCTIILSIGKPDFLNSHYDKSGIKAAFIIMA